MDNGVQRGSFADIAQRYPLVARLLQARFQCRLPPDWEDQLARLPLTAAEFSECGVVIANRTRSARSPLAAEALGPVPTYGMPLPPNGQQTGAPKRMTVAGPGKVNLGFAGRRAREP